MCSAEAPQGPGPAQLEARPSVLPLYPKERDCPCPGLNLTTATEGLAGEGWEHTGSGRALNGFGEGVNTSSTEKPREIIASTLCL